MGADLILEWLQIDKDKQPDFQAGAKYLEELAKKPMAEWPEDYIARHLGSDLSEYKPEEEVDTLKATLKHVEGAWETGYRDTSVIEVCHKQLLITGGMSWGDDPTESFADIDRALTSGLSKACGFDA
jgi:hypothetical protein